MAVRSDGLEERVSSQLNERTSRLNGAPWVRGQRLPWRNAHRQRPWRQEPARRWRSSWATTSCTTGVVSRVHYNARESTDHG